MTSSDQELLLHEVLKDSLAARSELTQSMQTLIAQVNAQTTLIQRVLNQQAGVADALRAHETIIGTLRTDMDALDATVQSLASTVHNECAAQADSRTVVATMSARVSALAGVSGAPSVSTNAASGTSPLTADYDLIDLLGAPAQSRSSIPAAHLPVSAVLPPPPSSAASRPGITAQPAATPDRVRPRAVHVTDTSAEAAAFLAARNIYSPTAIATLATMLSAADAEKDPSKRVKSADTWAKRLLDDGLKFEHGVTDVGDWLVAAREATAMFRAFADRVPGMVTDAWVCDRLLSLFHSSFRVRLTAANSAGRTPDNMLALVEANFQDKSSELSTSINLFPTRFKQPGERKFTDHVDANVRLYREHNVREKLTPSRYVSLFGTTHRAETLGRVFHTVARKELARKGITETSDAYSAGDLEPIRVICHALDREEAEHRSQRVAPAKPATAALDLNPGAPSWDGYDPNAGRGVRNGRNRNNRGIRGGQGGRGRGGQWSDPGADDMPDGMLMAPEPELAVNTSALKVMVSANIAAAHHSNALRQGRSPAVANKFWPLTQQAEMLAASLEQVTVPTADVSAATRSRSAVGFARTAREQSYDPDEHPKEVSEDTPVQVPLKQPGAGPSSASSPPVPSEPDASQPDPAAAEVSAEQPVSGPHGRKRPKRSKRKQRDGTATAEGSEPEAAVSPGQAPLADAGPVADLPTPRAQEVHPKRLHNKASSASRRRPALQADRGDVCDESDSDILTARRAQLEEFRREITSRNVPSRVCRAILQSTVTLSLAELAALAVQERLVTLLVQLAETLRDTADTSALEGSRRRADAFLASALRRVANRHESATPGTVKVVANAIATCADPVAVDKEWSKVLCTSAEWTKVPGKTSHFKVPFAKMRKCTGFLTSEVARPGMPKHPQGVRIAFDEGAEINTITKSAWNKHKADWAQGHPAFNSNDDIGPTHGIKMKGAVTLTSFHGDETRHTHMVLVHLRLGCACYPVYCTLVDVAPADIVLGLGFRRKHNAPFPPGYPEHQAMGVSSLCLGVPPGYGLYFPKALQQRFADRDPASTGFRQVLQLDTPWMVWKVEGKRLTQAQLTDAISGPVP